MTFTPIDDPQSTRIIILPKLSSSSESYELISLPNPRTLLPTKYLINTFRNQLLELKSFNYQNPHLPKNVITTRDGQVVKSIILNDENDGLVLEKLDFLIATNFNFTYLLISFYERVLELLTNDENYKLRLLNIDDLIEHLEADKLILGNIPRSFFKEDNKQLIDAIDTIFDKFDENGEIYYKLNQVKILKFLKAKVDAIVENFPKTMLRKLITEKLTPAPTPGEPLKTLSDDVIRSAKIHHSINIVSSYISPLLSLKLQKFYRDDLEVLTKHKKYIASINESQKLAEDNLVLLNANLKMEKRKTVTKPSTTTTKKKVVKKVEIGKGALDGFFKRG